MSFQVAQVDQVSGISPETFTREYLQKGRPVLVKGGICSEWPAYEKWDFEYFKRVAGNITVGLIANAKPGSRDWAGVSAPVQHMKLREYLDLICAQPTRLQLFALNVVKRARMLCDDFDFPDHLMPFNKNTAYMFFGGAGTVVNLHFDPDMNNLLQTQFGGRKRVLLFSPAESTKLYKLPLLPQSPIDPRAPDFVKYPRAKAARAYEVYTDHGDALFIPSGWWHYMEYPEPSCALTLRSASPFKGDQIRGFYNVVAQFVIDRFLHRLFGLAWFQRQEQIAIKRARSSAPAKA